MKRFFKSITLLERLVWSIGTVCASVCFFVFKNRNYHYLIGAVIGFTAVLFVAKGNLIGQVLTMIFSVFYGVISYTFKYYGEMITYLGMSLPMAAVALISWLKNPYKKQNGDNLRVQDGGADGKPHLKENGTVYAEPKVSNLTPKELILFLFAAVAVTAAFYFILKSLKTANLIISTLSVFTSFTAAYLTARRNRFYAIGYALNDIVLIIMWGMASAESLTYLPMIVCFCVFLTFDVYGFINWSRMSRRQKYNNSVGE